MTPGDLAAQLERIPAALVKLKLVELLEWQAAHNKRIINLGWYARCILFDYEKRPPKAGAEGRAKVAALVRQAGRI